MGIDFAIVFVSTSENSYCTVLLLLLLVSLERDWTAFLSYYILQKQWQKKGYYFFICCESDWLHLESKFRFAEKGVKITQLLLPRKTYPDGVVY